MASESWLREIILDDSSGISVLEAARAKYDIEPLILFVIIKAMSGIKVEEVDLGREQFKALYEGCGKEEEVTATMLKHYINYQKGIMGREEGSHDSFDDFFSGIVIEDNGCSYTSDSYLE